jgi:uncharacterized protein
VRRAARWPLATLAGGLLMGAALMPATVRGQAASAPASTPAAAPVSSPAKRELAQRLVTLQQSAIDGMVRNLVEGPARQLMAAGEPVLQTRVAPDKREATIKQVQDEVRKYVESATPIVRERANKLAQTTLLPALEEKFSEDELRQIVTFYESPVNKKLQQTMPEISASMTQKLVTESRPQIDPKIKQMEANVAKALGVPTRPAGAAPTTPVAPGQGLGGSGGGVKLGKPPAAPASKP